MTSFCSKPLHLLLPIVFLCSITTALGVQQSSAPPQILTLANRYHVSSIMYKHLTLLIAELETRINIKIELVDIPAARSLLLADHGKIDGEVARVRELNSANDYPNLVLVDAPWVHAKLVALHIPESIKAKHPIKDIQQLSVCFVRGSFLPQRIIKQFQVEKSVAVKSADEVVQMVAKGRCEVGLYWFEYANDDTIKTLQQYGIRFTDVVAEADGYIYLNVKHNELVPQLEQVLKAMEKDGTTDLIYAHNDISAHDSP